MKKILAFVPVAIASLSTYAAEQAANLTGTAVGWGDSQVKNVAEQASTTLQNFLTGIGPILGGLIVAGLAVWAIIALLPIIKRAFSAGKGR